MMTLKIKKIIWIALVAEIAGIFLSAAQASAATYNISGSVTVGSYGPGVSGVSVEADGDYESGYDRGSATTSSSGSYTIYSLNPGRYTVRASKSGYSISPSSRSVTLSYGNGSADFTTPGFYIEGYVKYDTGAAVSGASITATYPAPSTTTNSSGYYKISGLADKMYYVTASYNSVSQSQYVNVSGGNERQDFTFDTYSVSGYARYDEDGDYQGVGGVTVACKKSLTTVGSATTSSSGSYTINGLLPNTWYNLEASKSGYEIPDSSATFYSGTHDASEDFTVTPPYITGWLKYDTGEAIAGVQVNVGGHMVTTNGSGVYILRGCIPGTWAIIPPGGPYIWTPDRHDFTLNANSPYVTGKNFTAATFTLSGYVKQGDGTPIPGVTITIKRGETVIATVTSSDGSVTPIGYYEKPNLHGTYTVEASHPDYPFKPEEAAFYTADIPNFNLYTYIIKGYVKKYGTSSGVNGINVEIKEGETLIDTVTTQDKPGSLGDAGYYEKKVPGGTYTIEAENP